MTKEKILIVGTGTMGEGIAQTFAQNGFDVRLVARRDEPWPGRSSQIKQNIEQFIEFGLITEPADVVLGAHRGHGHHRHGQGRRGLHLLRRDHPGEARLQTGTHRGPAGGGPGADHRQQHRQHDHGHAGRRPAPSRQAHRHPLLQPGAHHPAGGGPPRHGLLRRHVRRDRAADEGLGQDRPRWCAKRCPVSSSTGSWAPSPGDRLHPRRRHLHSRGPQHGHQVQHRLSLRLPGPHGSGRHDRP